MRDRKDRIRVGSRVEYEVRGKYNYTTNLYGEQIETGIVVYIQSRQSIGYLAHVIGIKSDKSGKIVKKQTGPYGDYIKLVP